MVLIDEVDKAPRDFPNDILNEIENLRFTVTEIPETFQAKPEYRPFVLLTSNSERDLPDAFLRRCVFYYIPPPTREELIRIVETRMKPSSAFTPRMLENAVDHFEAIRKLALKKKPATAELLAWIELLDKMSVDVKNLRPGQAEILAFSYSILAKNRDDLAEIRKMK